MKKAYFQVICLVCFILSNTLSNQTIKGQTKSQNPALEINYCDFIDCYIFAQDSKTQYLGITSQNIYHAESIINDNGDYGSIYSSTSIRNSYSDYGSQYGSYSAYNSYALNPPIIYKYNIVTKEYEKVAYLSKNEYLSSGIYPILDPDILIITLEKGECSGTPTNNSPVFTSFPPIGDTYVDSKYDYQITTYDVEGDSRTITAPTLPSWLSFTDYRDGTARLSGTPITNNIGTHSVILRVNDGTSFTDQYFMISVVKATNYSPYFTSFPPIGETYVDSTYVYNISTNDIEGDALSITAPIIVEWLSLTDNGDGTAILSGTPSKSDLGIITSTIRVSDGYSFTDQEVMIIVESSNTLPLILSFPKTYGSVGSVYIYDIHVKDYDGDSIIISPLLSPAWLFFVDNGDGTGILSGLPLKVDVGNHNIKLVISDGIDTVFDEFILTIINDNYSPVFTSAPATMISVNIEYKYELSVIDFNGQTIIIHAESKPDWLVFTDFGDGKALLKGTPSNANIGHHEIVLSACDYLDTVYQKFSLVVFSTTNTGKKSVANITVYPNPTNNHLTIETDSPLSPCNDRD